MTAGMSMLSRMLRASSVSRTPSVSRPTRRSPRRRHPGSAAPPGTILIVDEDRSLLSLLNVIFKSAGFDVLTATDVPSALELLKNFLPRAIVLDLEMSGAGGRELFRNIRAQKVSTPVLILSAYNARSAQIELGAEAYISKPFDPDQLVEEVRRLIEAHPRTPR